MSAGVPSGILLAVVGWGEDRSAVLDVDLPFAVVDQAVMVPAQQNTVFQAGFAVVHRVCDVMTLAPAWWASAVGEGAALVPHDQGSADRSADGASFPSDVKDLSLPAEDH